MKGKSIERGGSLLGLMIFVTVLWYGNSPRIVISGTPYLIAAALICPFCFITTLRVKIGLKKGVSAQSLWVLQTRAQVLMLAAWQLAILGVLNIWADTFAGSFSIFVLSNLLVLACIIIADRFIALADSPSQDGGSKPMNIFGLSRSRRLFFWALIVYVSSIPAGTGVLLFTKMKPYPSPLHPPQLCLLLDAVYSAAAAGLVFQRYRLVASYRTDKLRFSLAALLVVGSATVTQFFGVGSLYILVLSSFTVLCTATSAYSLWKARNSGASELEAAVVPDGTPVPR